MFMNQYKGVPDLRATFRTGQYYHSCVVLLAALVSGWVLLTTMPLIFRPIKIWQTTCAPPSPSIHCSAVISR